MAVAWLRRTVENRRDNPADSPCAFYFVARGEGVEAMNRVVEAEHSKVCGLRDPLLTPDQAAQQLTTDTGTLANWRCSGRVQLPFVKIGRCVRYRLSDVEAFIEANVRGKAVA